MRASHPVQHLFSILASLTALAGVFGQSTGTQRTAPPAAPAENLSTAEKVALGKQLFFDPRLSGDNQMSCATCHLPEKAFTDGLPRARGAQGRELSRNTPGLLNVGFYESYFWDGRSATLEEQALVPIESAEEMNQDLDGLEAELAAVYLDMPPYSARRSASA
jgi:cytochrome c peroxidase